MSETNVPMRRRCVICGKVPQEVDASGNPAYHYPKTKEEARIWQRSMAANNVCLDKIKEQCCVCIEHIPEFVARAQRQSAKFKKQEAADAELRAKFQNDAVVDLCQCPDGSEGPGMNRPSVNVLVLSGATLPLYCGKAFNKNCGQTEIEGEEVKLDSDEDDILEKESESDTEIFVLESDFKDGGATFPDIDGTEVTVLRTPTQEDRELHQIAAKYDSTDGCADIRDCMTGCTDVLVLGRGLHPTDVCPCDCSQCTKKPTEALDQEQICCHPPCCPEEPQPEYFDQPPCGCECEQQVRRELGRVIKKQKSRIRELEELLCRQNKLHQCLQSKVDELYCEFGRVDDEERTQTVCSKRDGPDCSEVLKAKMEIVYVEQQEKIVQSGPPGKKHQKNITKSEAEAEQPNEEDEVLPRTPSNRVHFFSAKNPDKPDYRTRHPAWVSTVDSSDSIDSYRPAERIKRQKPTDGGSKSRIQPYTNKMDRNFDNNIKPIHSPIVSKSKAV